MMNIFASEYFQLQEKAYPLHFLSDLMPKGDMLWVQPLTGFVTTNRNMSEEEVVLQWSNSIFPNKSDDSYSAVFPFAQSRLFYVMQTVARFMGLDENSSVKWGDFATGEGVLLELLAKHYPNIELLATEHSPTLAEDLRNKGFMVEQRGLSTQMSHSHIHDLDISTLTWTLANCINPFSALSDVVERTKLGGFVCIAESSRIMVPFRKSLRDYISKTMPADLHPSHFSANTLRCLMELCGLEICHINRFFDSDVLLIIGKKVKHQIKPSFADNQTQVVDFFREWDKATKYFEALRLPEY